MDPKDKEKTAFRVIEAYCNLMHLRVGQKWTRCVSGTYVHSFTRMLINRYCLFGLYFNILGHSRRSFETYSDCI